MGNQSKIGATPESCGVDAFCAVLNLASDCRFSIPMVATRDADGSETVARILLGFSAWNPQATTGSSMSALPSGR
jgi:hypothetical protein